VNEPFGFFDNSLDNMTTKAAILAANNHCYIKTARTNLIEALELFFESADPTQIARRLHSEVFITRVEVAVG